MTGSNSQTVGTMLVIDDDHAFCRAITRTFAALTGTVLTAATYRDGLATARAHHPELVVVDYLLPDGSGIDLIQVLKREAPSTQLIMVSGYASVAVAVRAMRAGATTCLNKPVSPAEILGSTRDPSPEELRNDETPSLARIEWEYIHRVLDDCHGNISEAARRLGVYRQSLQRKLRKSPPRI